jgi:hypothetical protein
MLHSSIPGFTAKSKGAHDVYCGLGDQQPLLVHRGSPVAGFGLSLTTLTGAYCGCVDQGEEAAIIEKMNTGAVILCKTYGSCACLWREIILWEDGHPMGETEVVKVQKVKSKRQIEKVP